MNRKINVLVVDDSPLIRSILTELLNDAPDIRVVGVAEDPYEARELIKKLNPDVLTLDIEMPKMDGITFLKNLMRLRPMPVVMISTLTETGAPHTLEALEIGAIDYIAKPKQDVAQQLSQYVDEIYDKIRAAACANMDSANEVQRNQSRVSALKVNNPESLKFSTNRLVAIGASTGGTEAIKEVVNRLPANFCPVVVAQHIPPVFSTSFSHRLNASAKMNVQEAEEGMLIEMGNVYIAPGDDHLSVALNTSGKLVCRLERSAPVNRHRPAVDVLFNSVAEVVGKRAVGVILTGMGADGAQGLLNMKNVGCPTIGQNEKTCVVWGMPKAAYEIGAVDKQHALGDIADVLMRLVTKKKAS